jgi:bifunctional DNA-binding transcriptional regulator/antitoxin component of YhaV-PrlF toxin-antitoxin module
VLGWFTIVRLIDTSVANIHSLRRMDLIRQYYAALARLLPCLMAEWYGRCMSGMYQVVMGDRGRLVIPADLRARAGLAEGTKLIMLEAPTGLVLLTRPQLQELVRTDLAGLDLVGELLAERRAEAAAEDVA